MKFSGLLICLCMFFVSVSVRANDGDPVAGEAISQSCKACHGEYGITEHLMHPNLAGQNEIYLVWQLNNFKTEQRIGHHMNDIAKKLSSQDIKDLAAYYSQINSCE